MKTQTKLIELSETELALLIFATNRAFSMRENEARELADKLQTFRNELAESRINQQPE